MDKIKICYVISSLSNQGPPNVLYNIIQYMDFNKFEVSIITMVPEQEISRINEFRALPIRIIQMSPDKVLNPLSMYFTLRKKVHEINPDILHTHCPRSMFLVPFLSKKYKKVETVHIYPGIQQKVMYGNLKGSIVIALSHYFTMRMDLPIACSESVAESYWNEHHYRMKAIPNGCSLPLSKKNNEQKQEMRKRLGLKTDLKYFIFIGRFSQEKNPDFIVKAFEEINNKDIGVILLGDGNMYAALKSHENGNILLPGFKSNVYDYLIASDYYISASDVEGLANTLLESMTVGLPCVLSNIPSHREVIRKAQNPIGYTFNNHDMEDLKDAIRKVLILDYEQTSDYIQHLFENYYMAQSMSKKYQNAYIELLSKR